MKLLHIIGFMNCNYIKDFTGLLLLKTNGLLLFLVQLILKSRLSAIIS
jgi:hypothetical protein